MFYGNNGAGKTSVLESVHFLSHVRSFKTRTSRFLINHSSKYFRIVSDISENGLTQRIGMEKTTDKFLASINGDRINKPSAVADLLPAIAIHPEIFTLLTGDPSEKRAFLDWGSFYHDSKFKVFWRQFQQSLKQRNAALRSKAPEHLVQCWNRALAENGEMISKMREEYLLRIAERIPGLIADFDQDIRLDLRYARGWPTDVTLEEQLEATFESDRQRGFTQSGPQRGGFKTYFNGRETTQIASRGQLKLITIILKLSQAIEFVESRSRRCVLLLDDLDAELDHGNFDTFLGIVKSLGLQSLLTTLDRNIRFHESEGNTGVFHVEHGKIKQVL